MAIGRDGAALRQLGALLDAGTLVGLTDGQLLERFATSPPEAAEAAFADDGWRKLTMAKVADRAGVSRQTVYNEFGTKHALAEHLVLRELGVFLDVVAQRFTAESEFPEAIAAAVSSRAPTDDPADTTSTSLSGNASRSLVASTSRSSGTMPAKRGSPPASRTRAARAVRATMGM